MMLIEPFAADTLRANETNQPNVLVVFDQALHTRFDQPGSWLSIWDAGGEKRLGEFVAEGGFTRFRLATEMPFNLVLEVQPSTGRLGMATRHISTDAEIDQAGHGF